MPPPAPPHPSAAPPTVVALLTCAAFHIDDTRKAYLLGVFNGYTAPRFPATMPTFFVYLALTDGHGPTPLVVRLVDGADDDAPPLWSFDLTAKFAGPLDVKEAALEVPRSPSGGRGCTGGRCCARARSSTSGGSRSPGRTSGGPDAPPETLVLARPGTSQPRLLSRLEYLPPRLPNNRHGGRTRPRPCRSRSRPA